MMHQWLVFLAESVFAMVWSTKNEFRGSHLSTSEQKGIFDNTVAPINIDEHLLVIQALASIAHALLDDEQHLTNLSDIPGVLGRHWSCMTHVCKFGNELHNQTEKNALPLAWHFFFFTLFHQCYTAMILLGHLHGFIIPVYLVLEWSSHHGLNIKIYYLHCFWGWLTFVVTNIWDGKYDAHFFTNKIFPMITQRGYSTRSLIISEHVRINIFSRVGAVVTPEEKSYQTRLFQNHFPKRAINHRQHNPAMNFKR